MEERGRREGGEREEREGMEEREDRWRREGERERGRREGGGEREREERGRERRETGFSNREAYLATHTSTRISTHAHTCSEHRPRGNLLHVLEEL